MRLPSARLSGELIGPLSADQPDDSRHEQRCSAQKNYREGDRSVVTDRIFDGLGLTGPWKGWRFLDRSAAKMQIGSRASILSLQFVTVSSHIEVTFYQISCLLTVEL